MKRYEDAIMKAKILNQTTFDFIEGVNVMTATLLAGNTVKVEQKGTLMKSGIIKLEKGD